MVMLDTDIAGCYSTWLSQSGPLDGDARRALRQCLEDLDRVVPRLDVSEERVYYERLRAIAKLLH
jgi:hypothetical protein